MLFATFAGTSQAASFGPAQTVRSGQTPEPWVQAADVDRDGDGDILYSPSAGKLDLLKRNADGTWTTVPLITSGVLRVLNAVTADFDGDGWNDVAAYVQSTATETGIRVIRQTSGTFNTAGAGYFNAGAAPAPQAPLRMADVNADGKTDLVLSWKTAATGSSKGRAGWMRNTGAGTFAAPAALFLQVFDEPCDVLAGDFNRDGAVDIAVADNANNEIRVCPGPTFNPGVPFALPAAPRRMEIIDRNRDGFPDLLVAMAPLGGSGGVGLRAYYGSAAGFSQANNYLFSATTLTVQTTMNVADFDLDGRTDAVCGFNYGTTLFLDNGGVTTQSVPAATFSQPSGSSACFDDDGDGDDDLICGTATGLVRMANLAPHRTITGEAATVTGPAGSAPSGSSAYAGYATADFNRDSRMDMASVSSSNGEIRVLLNSGGTALTSVLAGNNPSCRWLTAGDFDGDGDADLAAPSIATSRVVWYENNGTGAQWTTHVIPYAINAPVDIATGDINQDGIPDLVTVSATGYTIHVLTGDGGGGWTGSILASLPGVYAVEVADILPGGRPEIVARHGSAGSVSYLRYISGGWTAIPVISQSASVTEGLTTADLDGNGLLDVVTGNGSTVLAAMQTSAGNFGSPVVVGGSYQLPVSAPLPGPIRVVRTADLDLDGRPEVIAACDRAIVVYSPERAQRPFRYPVMLAAGSTELQADAAIINFDDDAVPDILHHSPTGNRIVASVLSAPGFTIRSAAGWQPAETMNYPVQDNTGVVLLRLGVTSAAWPGDAPVRLEKLAVRFLQDDAAKTPFTQQNMPVMFGDFSIWSDDGMPGVLEYYDPYLSGASPGAPDAAGTALLTLTSPPVLAAGSTRPLFLGSMLGSLYYSGFKFRVELKSGSFADWATYTPSSITKIPVASLVESTTAARFVVGTPTVRQGWRDHHFHSPSNLGRGADYADYDGDGIPNILEYALGLNPKQRDAGVPMIMQSEGNAFFLSWRSEEVQPDVDLRLYSSTDLYAWYPKASRDPDGGWTATSGTITPGNFTSGLLQQVYSKPRAPGGKEFFRLEATELAP